jgi:hypothetical protein
VLSNASVPGSGTAQTARSFLDVARARSDKEIVGGDHWDSRTYAKPMTYVDVVPQPTGICC